MGRACRKRHRHRLADVAFHLPGDLHREFLAARQCAIEKTRRAQLFELFDCCVEAQIARATTAQPNVLGTNANCDLGARRDATAAHRNCRYRRGVRVGIQCHLHSVDVHRRHFAADEIHPRRADEPGDESVGRRVVEIERRADLFDPAAAQHDDLVGHGHRLDLVVGDIDHRRLQPFVQRRDLGAHLHAQLGIEVGQRLVEQEDGRFAHDRTADRDPLALAARELARLPVEQGAELQQLRRGLDLGVDVGLRRADVLQAECHVLVHRHVRVERVGLEDHRQPALRRRHVVDPLAVDQDLAVAHAFEPGDHAQ